MSQANQRLSTVMFTDMVGYQDALKQDESLAKFLLDKQKSIILRCLSPHGGKDVGGNLSVGEETGLKSWIKGTGGKTQTRLQSHESLVLFESALDAARCAVEIQRMLRDYNLEAPSKKDIYVRIGIHLGGVAERAGEISGEAVAIASRVAPLAEPGGICISEKVYRNVRDKFELPLQSLGVQTLKNLTLPLEVYNIVIPWSEEKVATLTHLDRKRIAVLPFANISPDPADEYFADGMTEELITSLSGLSELTVIGRTSVMRYKSGAKSLSEIGRELGAGSLVEGSVRKAADRLRITVQLVDSQSQGHVWAQNYDRKLEDIFAIQSEIAESVTRELKVRIVESEKRRMDRRPTESTEAYTLYLKGRYYWNERSEEALNKAIGYFNQSVRLDPGFSLGYSGLADCYLVMGFNGQAEFVPSFEKARDFATKALELDPNLAEAHTVLAASIHNLEFEFEKSGLEMRRAIELNPNYSTAHQWYSQTLWFQRRFQDAETEIRTALDLDPLSLIINVNYGDVLYYRGKIDSAIEQYLKVIQMDSAFYPAHLGLINAYVRKKLYAEALREVEAAGELTRSPWGGKLGRAYVYASMGKAYESRKLLEEVEEVSEPELRRPYGLAMVYFLLGDKERGFELLQKAYEERDSNLNGLAVDYELEGIRNDPRYVTLVNRMGLPRSMQ